VLRGPKADPANPMGLFPDKKPPPIIGTGIKMRQDLLEKLDWMAQREGYSRNKALEYCVELAIGYYEKEHHLVVDRLSIDTKKKRHRSKRE